MLPQVFRRSQDMADFVILAQPLPAFLQQLMAPKVALRYCISDSICRFSRCLKKSRRRVLHIRDYCHRLHLSSSPHSLRNLGVGHTKIWGFVVNTATMDVVRSRRQPGHPARASSPQPTTRVQPPAELGLSSCASTANYADLARQSSNLDIARNSTTGSEAATASSALNYVRSFASAHTASREWPTFRGSGKYSRKPNIGSY